jgi:hypothetical protein
MGVVVRSVLRSTSMAKRWAMLEIAQNVKRTAIVWVSESHEVRRVMVALDLVTALERKARESSGVSMGLPRSWVLTLILEEHLLRREGTWERCSCLLWERWRLEGLLNTSVRILFFSLVEVNTIGWTTCDDLLKKPQEIDIGNVGEKEVIKESGGGSLGALSVIVEGWKRGRSGLVVMGVGRGKASSGP